MMRIKLFLVSTVAAMALLSVACSTVQQKKTPEVYDAVRIKPEYESMYDTIPGLGIYRNGSTLKGQVFRLQRDYRQVVEGIDTTIEKTEYFVFRDYREDAPIERIRIEHIDLIGPKIGLDTNWVENFNDPLNINDIREIPVAVNDIPVVKPGEILPEDCSCQPLSVMFPDIGFKCPVRSCSWYFIELRGGYAAYTDKVNTMLEEGSEAYMGEIAAGFRWGRWGLGLAFSTGAPTYNSLERLEEGEKIDPVYRPTTMLHLRYEFTDKCTANKASKFCIDPFVYGQLGVAIDDMTLDLMKVNGNCCDGYDADLPGIDGSFPLSYSLGAGVDIPLNSYMDVSFDIGYRSLSFGESSVLLGFDNYPSRRRVGMFVLRCGITI